MNKQLTIGNVPHTPEEAGYESAYIGKLNDFITRMIDDNIIQGGSYHLMRHGKTFANNAIGSLDYREPGKPMLPDSIMRIASITKNFTAVAVFMLAEQGYIDITDPVAAHLPEFDTSVHKKITVYNLLTHTSGLLPDWGAFDIPYENDFVNHLDTFEGSWIKAMLTQPPHCKPNTQWAYSSRGFCFLGEIVQRISGKPFEEFVIDNIVKPLGMNDTFYNVPEELFDRMIVSCNDNIPVPKEKQKKNKGWSQMPRAGWGLHSTLSDLNIFRQMLHNNGIYNGVRIIGRKSVENMTHPHLKGQNLRSTCWGADEVLYEFGLGFEVMGNKQFHQTSIGTYGHEGAGVSWSYVDPKEDFIASMFLPYHNGEFNMTPIHRTKYVIWSGLL